MNPSSKSRKFLAIVSVVLLIMTNACKKQQSGFEKILIDKQKCWAHYSYSREEIDTAKMIPLGCTRFYEGGDMQVMSMDGNKDKPKELYILDKVHANEVGWSFNAEDSTLKVGEDIYNQFKVTSFSADTISLRKVNGEIHTLVNVK